MKTKEEIIQTIDMAIQEEGFDSFDEVDSLSRMIILDHIEDHFDVNIDLAVLENITTKEDLVLEVFSIINGD